MAQATMHDEAGRMPQYRLTVAALKLLLVMIIGLMALGAGVRAMNAGLSCPDWPLCFGKLVPDFHPAVWFEFVHRAYAGVVALIFFATCGHVLFRRGFPPAARRAAGAGFLVLLLQIAAGGLTVLWKVKWFTVTSHLMLATLFFTSVLSMLLAIQPRVVKAKNSPAPCALAWLSGVIAAAIFMQIFVGGVVAATYAGSVCVDWPLCNGQWFPTWQGAIGLQIIHRMIAYGLAVILLVFAGVMFAKRRAPWMTPQLLNLSLLGSSIVFIQIGVGVANLVLFIPPAVTVLHQTVGILLFGVNLRLFHVARVLSRRPREATELGIVLKPFLEPGAL